LLAAFVPALRKLLGTTPVSPLDALVIAGGAGLPFLVNELNKTLRTAQRARLPLPEQGVDTQTHATEQGELAP
jgi:hypothetical protein